MLTVVSGGTVCPGTSTNLDRLPNSSFISYENGPQTSHLDSAAVALTLTSVWPSVESRKKTKHNITVWPDTRLTTSMCSHSDKASYKNLPQSHSHWLHWYTPQVLTGRKWNSTLTGYSTIYYLEIKVYFTYSFRLLLI